MRNLDELFEALAKNRFRSRFRLRAPERAYLAARSLSAVLDHGRVFLQERLIPAMPKNEGKQTPMRGHPFFVAQHATGTCCRSCLWKWHKIAPGRTLSEAEVEYVLAVISRWLSSQPKAEATQMELF